MLGECASRAIADILHGGHIDSIERYAAGEGPAGTVKHGRFVVAGQDMVAMDSHIDHGVSFNEALSLQVRCEDQAELVRYWDALAEGGEHGHGGA
ncbi:MAG TPA: VOC family protein [Polyangiales bacterium]